MLFIIIVIIFPALHISNNFRKKKLTEDLHDIKLLIKQEKNLNYHRFFFSLYNPTRHLKILEQRQSQISNIILFFSSIGLSIAINIAYISDSAEIDIKIK